MVVLEELCKGAFVSWFLDKDGGLDFDEEGLDVVFCNAMWLWIWSKVSSSVMHLPPTFLLRVLRDFLELVLTLCRTSCCHKKDAKFEHVFSIF